MADTVTREQAHAMDSAERERKLAEIEARSAAVLGREHEIRMKYLVSALSSDQIRRTA